VPLSLTGGSATVGSVGRHGSAHHAHGGRQVKGQYSETTLGAESMGVMKTVEYDSDESKYGDYPPAIVGDHNV